MSCSLPTGASDVSAEEEWAAAKEKVAVVKEEAVREALVAEGKNAWEVVAVVSVEIRCKVSGHPPSRVQYLYATPIVA